MPPGVLLFEATTNAEYLSPLVTSAIGWALLAGMALLMGVGAFMMMRMIKLEV
jgi:Flp pilus assembly protein TadB